MNAQITRIAEVEDALIAVLTQSLGLLEVKNVGTLSAEDIDDGDSIVTETPALRLFFTDEQLSSQELTATNYESTQNFVVLCGAQDLRGKDPERKGAYDLVSNTCDALAGASLSIASHPQRPQVVLKAVRLMQSNENGTWYAMQIAVKHFHAFSGDNADRGEG